MMLRYIADHEKRPVRLDELDTSHADFIPDNPADRYGHGVDGTLHIIYELRQSKSQ